MSKRKKLKDHHIKWRREYRHTLNGVVTDMYDKMRSRCVLGDTVSPHLYLGKFIPTPKDFREFALKDSVLPKLYRAWKRSGYSIKLRPTPDRINISLGYELFNIRFLTFSANRKLAKTGRKKRA